MIGISGIGIIAEDKMSQAQLVRVDARLVDVEWVALVMVKPSPASQQTLNF